MLKLTWLQKEVKPGWEKQVKKEKGLREGKRIGELARFWWVGTERTAPTSSTEIITTFYRELLFSSSCSFTLGFLPGRRSTALSTQWVHLGNAGWNEGGQHPNCCQRPKKPFKFKGGETQLILGAWCGPSRTLTSVLPIKFQCKMLQWSRRLWFHYPAEGWGEHRCGLSLFQGVSYLLFLQEFLPCMSGSAACQGLGKSLLLIFCVVQNAGLAFQVPFVWKVVWIFTALLEGRECRFLFPVTGVHLQ